MNQSHWLIVSFTRDDIIISPQVWGSTIRFTKIEVELILDGKPKILLLLIAFDHCEILIWKRLPNCRKKKLYFHAPWHGITQKHAPKVIQNNRFCRKEKLCDVPWTHKQSSERNIQIYQHFGNHELVATFSLNLTFRLFEVWIMRDLLLHLLWHREVCGTREQITI